MGGVCFVLLCCVTELFQLSCSDFYLPKDVKRCDLVQLSLVRTEGGFCTPLLAGGRELLFRWTVLKQGRAVFSSVSFLPVIVTVGFCQHFF